MVTGTQLTIVKFGYPLQDFRHTALDEALVDLLGRAHRRGPQSLQNVADPVKLLECVAQLLRLSICGAPLSVAPFWRLCVNYLGAINSQKFIDAPFTWRERQTRSFISTLKFLRNDGFFVPHIQIATSTGELNSSLLPFVEVFDEAEYDREAQWLWRGWPSHNADARLCTFPLQGVYARLGRIFTQKLYEALDTYYAKGLARYFAVLRPILECIETFPGVSEESLKDEDFMGLFWAFCVEHYVTTRHATGSQLETLLTNWNSGGRLLIRDCLEPSGLFAQPRGGMPSVPSMTKQGANTALKKTEEGIIVKTRLLTDVPINETEEEALQRIFIDISRDVAAIETWAQSKCTEIENSIVTRNQLATVGAIRTLQPFGSNDATRWAISTANPDRFKNAAATFAHYGFFAHTDKNTGLLYPRPLAKTAESLGLPITGAFLPHLALLVIDHPKITASFLEKCELFDTASRISGYFSLDGTKYLRSKKDRKGTFQDIPLTPRGERVVEGIMAMTQPVRDYLRTNGDDKWRYLLIHCNKAFGKPERLLQIAGWTSHPRTVSRLSKEISSVTTHTVVEAHRLAERFSLATLRASVGVLVYLDTGSVEKMADALGHSQYEPRLLEHYLPEPILRFFQERWIRVFQAGMITYAMADSPFLLEASGLKDHKELNEFLIKHAFKPLEHSEPPKYQGEFKKAYVSIDENILSFLVQLKDAVDTSSGPVSTHAAYWALFAKRLIEHITNDGNGQEELQLALNQSKKLNVNYSFASLIRGN